MRKRLLLGLVLFTLGLSGIFSLLLVHIPTKSIPKEALQMLSQETLKWLMLINPTILLFASIFLGIFTFNKVGLKVPIIGKLIGFSHDNFHWKEIIIYGIGLGSLAGIIIVLVSYLFKASHPEEFTRLNQDIDMHILTKLLYGGITEELLTRFGLMSLFTYLCSLIFKSASNIQYWLGIFLCSFIFGLGHLPIVFSVIETPNIILILYIVLGNLLAGVVFGWLYWKKGLESAMIGHMSAHIFMVTLNNLFTSI